MRFVCDSCRAQYMISDEKVGAKGVKVRCKKCGYVILVRRQETGAAPPMLEPAPQAESSAESGSPGGASGGGGGAIFKGMEDDEIGAVFDQVLSGPGGGTPRPTIDAAAPQNSGGDEDDSDSTRVMDLATMKALTDQLNGQSAKPANGAAHGNGENGAAPPEAAPVQHEWFVAIDERQVGPLTVEKVKDHWDRGEIGPDSLCWRSGFNDWIPVSEATELQKALTPRAPRPMIAAPVATVSAQSPVGSAFAAGASGKVTDTSGMRADAPGDAENKSAWKPTAASALASLVQDEIAAMNSPKPSIRPKGPSSSDQVPVAPASSGLLDMPDAPAAPAQNMPAATDTASAQTQGYSPAPYTPSYSLPPPQPEKGRGLLVVGIIGAVVVLGLLGAIVFFLAKGQSQQPQIVTVQQPMPIVVAQNTPPVAPTAAVTKPPVTAPTVVTPPTPVVPTPPVAPQLTVPGNDRGPHQRGRNGKGGKGEKGETGSAGQGAKPVDNTPGTAPAAENTDEFDREFGGSPSGAKKEPKKNHESVYVPPAPGEASIPDTLEQSDIMQVVLSHKPAIVKCANEQKAQDPGASGRMVMRWTVTPGGRTSGISVQTDDMKTSHLATCLTAQIKSWTFPKHKVQGDPIDFPFTF